MTIPDDVVTWINGHFREIDRATAIGLLEDAVDEWDKPVEARLLRCLVIGARGDIDRLTDLVEELRIPMRAGVRSLNLSNAVAIAVYEAWRQGSFAGSGVGP